MFPSLCPLLPAIRIKISFRVDFEDNLAISVCNGIQLWGRSKCFRRWIVKCCRPFPLPFDVEYICGFVGWGGLQTKSMTSQRNRAVKDGGYLLLWHRYDNNKMADMCYYGNVMTITRWRICVTMATL